MEMTGLPMMVEVTIIATVSEYILVIFGDLCLDLGTARGNE